MPEYSPSRVWWYRRRSQIQAPRPQIREAGDSLEYPRSLQGRQDVIREHEIRQRALRQRDVVAHRSRDEIRREELWRNGVYHHAECAVADVKAVGIQRAVGRIDRRVTPIDAHLPVDRFIERDGEALSRCAIYALVQFENYGVDNSKLGRFEIQPLPPRVGASGMREVGRHASTLPDFLVDEKVPVVRC